MITATILTEPRSDMDPRTTWAHIGRWTLARIGARNLSYSSDHVAFDVSCGPRRRRRVIVALRADDTYAVEVGRTDRRSFEWISDRITRGVHVDQLADTIEHLYVEVFEG